MTMKLLISLLLALLLASCASQEGARDLAEETSANTAQLSAALTQMATAERQVAAKRARTIAEYDYAVSESQAALAYRKTLMKEAGEDSTISLMTAFETWVAKAQESAKIEGGTPQQRAAAIVERQEPIHTKAAQLVEVAKILDKLSQEANFSARASFLIGYFEEVGNLVAANEESMAVVKALVGTASENVMSSTTSLPKAGSGSSTP